MSIYFPILTNIRTIFPTTDFLFTVSLQFCHCESKLGQMKQSIILSLVSLKKLIAAINASLIYSANDHTRDTLFTVITRMLST